LAGYLSHVRLQFSQKPLFYGVLQEKSGHQHIFVTGGMVFVFGRLPTFVTCCGNKRLLPTPLNHFTMSSRKKVVPPAVFSPEELEQFRQRLLAERQRIEDSLKSSRDNLANRGQRENIEETGSEDFIHSVDLSMMATSSESLRLIDEALENIRLGTYGICRDCGKRIGIERLEFRPYARYCITCKSAREANGTSHLHG
jgi:DnaK suppressor protein